MSNNYIHSLEVQGQEYHIGLDNDMVSSGVSVNDGVISTKLGRGLKFDNNNQITINCGDGLGFNGNQIYVSASTNDGTSANLNNYVKKSEYSSFSSNTNTRITNLSTAITTEASARENADDYLQSQIDALKNDSGNDGNVNLSDYVTTSALNLAKSDVIASANTYTNSKVFTEETARKDADALLQQQIHNLTIGSGNVDLSGYVTTSALTTTLGTFPHHVTINGYTVSGATPSFSGLTSAITVNETTFEANENGIIKINANSGLTVDNNGISVNIGTGLKIVGNKLTVTASTNSGDINLSDYVTINDLIDTYVSGNVQFNGEGFDVQYSSGLTINNDNQLIAKLSKGLGFDSDSKIKFNYGRGLVLDGSSNEIYVNCSLSGAISQDSNSNYGLMVNVGDGLKIVDNKLTVTASTNSGDIDLSDYVTTSALTSALNSKLDSNKVYVWEWNGKTTSNGNIDSNVYNNIINAEVLLIKNSNNNTVIIGERKKFYDNDQIDFDCIEFNKDNNTITKYSFCFLENMYQALVDTITVATSSDLENLIDFDTLDDEINDLQDQISDLSSKTITGIKVGNTGATVTNGVADISDLLPNGVGSGSNNVNIINIDSSLNENLCVLQKGKNIINEPIDNLTITNLSGSEDSLYSEYQLSFQTSKNSSKGFGFPDDLIWANGIEPSFHNDMYYELSISVYKIGDKYIRKAVLIPFNYTK